MFLLLLYNTLFWSLGAGRPVSADSDNAPTVGWVSDPNGRGTSGLIISCVVTLSICVWSAMHLNIPPKDDTRLQYWCRSLKWVVLGVFVPELVVLSAWRQWLSARKMSKELETIFADGKAKNQPPRRYEWTVVHSYYAGMGGFVFDADCFDPEHPRLWHGPERLTLTASGVLLLAECGCLPDIDKASIKDKSKADALAKTLVCLQSGWMIVQIGGRLITNEPVTLLEVNTLGHIFCAFVIYVLWWQKPKEVHAPIVLEGDWVAKLSSYMFMSSRISGSKVSGLITLSQWIKPELSKFAWYPPESEDSRSISSSEECKGVHALRRTDPECTPDGHRSAASRDRYTCYDSEWFGTLRSRPAPMLTGLPSTIITPVVSSDDNSDHLQEARHRACCDAIVSFSAVRKRFHHPDARQISPWLKPETTNLVTDTASNWPCDYYLPGISGELMGMALWLSSSLYGGIHMAAWSDYFPTTVEKELWRFSATYIACSGGFWFLLCIVAYRWPFASNYWDRFIELRARKIEYALLGLGATICGIAYVFARVFLVADAIVSLRRLPSGAYDTPNWAAIFPHF